MWVWFAGWAVALSVVDIREHRLPNPMVLASVTGAFVIAAVGSFAQDDWWVLARALGACLAAVAVFAIAHVVGGMGMGDVKYAASTGLVLGTIGWSAVWWGHFLGFVLAGLVVAVGLITRTLHRRSKIPFGPFMAAGATLVGVGSFLA